MSVTYSQHPNILCILIRVCTLGVLCKVEFTLPGWELCVWNACVPELACVRVVYQPAVLRVCTCTRVCVPGGQGVHIFLLQKMKDYEDQIC